MKPDHSYGLVSFIDSVKCSELIKLLLKGRNLKRWQLTDNFLLRLLVYLDSVLGYQ